MATPHTYDLNQLPNMPAEQIVSWDDSKSVKVEFEGVNVLRFNDFGTYFAVGTRKGDIYILDWPFYGIARKWKAHHQPVTDISWTHCGRYLLSVSNREIKCFDTDGVPRFFHSARIWFAAINPKNSDQIVYAESGKPGVSFVSIKDGTHEMIQPDNEDLPVPDRGAFDQSGKYFITGYEEGTVVVYDTQKKAVINIRKTELGDINVIRVGRRGDKIILTSSSKNKKPRREAKIVAYSLNTLLEPKSENSKDEVWFRHRLGKVSNARPRLNIATLSAFSNFVVAVGYKCLVFWRIDGTPVTKIDFEEVTTNDWKDNPIVKREITNVEEDITDFEKEIIDYVEDIPYVTSVDWHPLEGALIFSAGEKKHAYSFTHGRTKAAVCFGQRERIEVLQKTAPGGPVNEGELENKVSNEDLPAPENYPGAQGRRFDEQRVMYNKRFAYRILRLSSKEERALKRKREKAMKDFMVEWCQALLMDLMKHYKVEDEEY
ncbi:hypothetical protein L596_018271 [Steinernema carpocapsae]|uniref:Uncharacterized protein n=2 Tax=Steinernema carpocapsae TaxID=34508 RepID=A0A4U5N4G3_STECR|nr:hypothetical protein L596_018271 [Steinernema carpocapsae]